MRRAKTDTTTKPRSAPSDDGDLRFLFCEAEGEIGGLRSVHGALVEMAQTGATMAGAGTRGIPRSVEGITERQAAAVSRERPLRERLARLTPQEQDVLRRAYGPCPILAVDERQRLGRWAWVGARTVAARRGWDAEYRRRLGTAKDSAARLLEVERWRARGLVFWLRGPGIDADDLAAIREEAQALVTDAWTAWRWRGVPEQWRDEGDRESAVYPTVGAMGMPGLHSKVG